MESSLLFPCYICKKPLLENYVLSTCGHSLCFLCLPFLIYSKLQTAGLQSSFFSLQTLRQKCLICGDGDFSLTKPLFEFLSNHKKPVNPQPQNINSMCDACEKKPAKTKCVDCNQNYCEACAQFMHEVNKKFINHKMQNVEKQMVTKEEFNCFCSNKKIIQDFCLQCEIGICKFCSIIDHKGHKQISIEELMSQKMKMKFPCIQAHLFEVRENLTKLQNEIMGSATKAKEMIQKELTDFVNEVHALVNKHKEKTLEKINEELQSIKLQMSWINETIGFLGFELEETNNFHPNVLFQILKYFSHSMDKKEIVMHAPKINNNKFVEKLEEIDKLLTNLMQGNSNLIGKEESLLFKIKNIPLNTEENLKMNSNPKDFIKSQAVLLDKYKLELDFFKSNLTVFFSTDGQSLFAMPGASTLNYHPINVYNISLRKKLYMFSYNNSRINLLSIYPKYPRKTERKWLYSADKSGFLRVFEEQGLNKQFQETYNINAGAEIIEAVIFEDKFDEIIKNSKDKLIAILAFSNSNVPIKIFHLTNGGGQVVKIIMNYNSEQCWSMNYYYDEILLKTSLFIGLKSVINCWDLKTHIPLQQIQAKAAVFSMRFLLDFENRAMPKRFLIYSQNNNSVTIADIDTSVIVRQVALQNVTLIYDICIWRRKDEFILIAATHGNLNGMKVLKFETLEVVASRETGRNYPLNLRKGWMEELGKKKECLIGVEFAGDKVLSEFEIKIYS